MLPSPLLSWRGVVVVVGEAVAIRRWAGNRCVSTNCTRVQSGGWKKTNDDAVLLFGQHMANSRVHLSIQESDDKPELIVD